MSWRKMTMKFAGTCIVCKKKIEENEVGLWSKGIGVKHLACAEVKELRCLVCGGPAGCPQCEFRTDCNLAKVSQLCICKKCNNSEGAFISYQKAVAKKFPILNLKT
ncbi:MAG: hypothetical protein HY295_05330 [Thaumarchaeota archaeon]|nr:hypothetical protein [Nitrososphaerota archaeon]